MLFKMKKIEKILVLILSLSLGTDGHSESDSIEVAKSVGKFNCLKY